MLLEKVLQHEDRPLALSCFAEQLTDVRKQWYEFVESNADPSKHSKQ